jgi:hypothetical protein
LGDFNGALQVNYSSGRYFSGSAEETAARLPFDAGFEVIDVLTCLYQGKNSVLFQNSVALL